MQFGPGGRKRTDHVLIAHRIPYPLVALFFIALGIGRPVEVVSGAERGALGVEEDHPYVCVALGVVDGGPELVAQLGRDRVVSLGTAQGEAAHMAVCVDTDGGCLMIVIHGLILVDCASRPMIAACR